MRLIFKGKILKDELTIEDFKITDGLTIHLVKGKTAAASGATSAEVPASSGTTTEASAASGTGAASAGLAAGGPGANPFAGMGGLGGMGGMGPMGGMGGMGGMP